MTKSVGQTVINMTADLMKQIIVERVLLEACELSFSVNYWNERGNASESGNY